MRDTTEQADPETQSVELIVTDLHRPTAFGFITPDGELVCVVDRRASVLDALLARESANKTFAALLAS